MAKYYKKVIKMKVSPGIVCRTYGAVFTGAGGYTSYVTAEAFNSGAYLPGGILALLSALVISDGIGDIITGEHHYVMRHLVPCIERFAKRE